MKPNQNKTKRGQENFLGDAGNICHHDCGAGFRGVCLSPNQPINLLNTCSFWISITHLDKAVKTKGNSYLRPLGDSDVHLSVCV